jgi:hypothetical protein
VPPEKLHPYRLEIWLKRLDQARRDHMQRIPTVPTARMLYEEVMVPLRRTARK